MRRRAMADMDQPVDRHAAPARLGKAGDEKPAPWFTLALATWSLV